MRTLIKIGGTLLDLPQLRDGLAGQIAAARRAGHELAIVHGGGKQITRFLDSRGIQSRFVNGMRVTTPEILDAVLTVLRGVNADLVQALAQAGVDAIGIIADDGTLVEAEQMDPELGAVGRVVRCHSNGFATAGLPVVACIAGDLRGNRYNVNGDLMAVACASGFHAQRLIFLTDVDGVLDAERRILPSLTKAAAGELISQGIATGGMQAKLQAAISALEQGVQEVRIVPGAAEMTVSRILNGDGKTDGSGTAIGTRVIL